MSQVVGVPGGLWPNDQKTKENASEIIAYMRNAPPQQVKHAVETARRIAEADKAEKARKAEDREAEGAQARKADEATVDYARVTVDQQRPSQEGR